MIFSDGFLLDIQRIHLAHEFVLDRIHKCEYPRGRGQYGLIYAIEGRAEYRFFSGERITVTDGNVLFLAPYVAYSIVTEQEFRHYTVNFDLHGDTSGLDSLDKPYCLLQRTNTEQLRRGFLRLTSIWMLKKAGFEMQAIGCLYELLSMFYLDYTNRQNTASYRRLLDAKEYMEQHFAEPVRLELLAKRCDMSVTNFRREWKKQYGETPLQYRDSVRLYYAKEYLRSGYYTVSETAVRCGFEDVSYFVRFFRKHTGVTPGSYREMLNG